MNREYARKGSFEVKFSKAEVFPLLCPKMEEKWIPNWECQVVYSLSGYNENGAIFKTEKAFGTELIWFTNMYNKINGRIEFTCFATDKIVFNFIIQVQQLSERKCQLTFSHKFIALSSAGVELIKTYKAEDFQVRLLGLGKLIESYLTNLSLFHNC